VPALREPGAGSDLAGLATKAVEQDGEFIINGQKVWTSGARWPTWASPRPHRRERAEAPGHHVGSTFADKQPGVDVRPLREMTDTRSSAEVFNVRPRASRRRRSNRWAEQRLGPSANTTLMFERQLARRRRRWWRATFAPAGQEVRTGSIAASVTSYRSRRERRAVRRLRVRA